MSTRSSLLFKSWPKEIKKYGKWGFRKELTIHIYHDCHDDEIYFNFNFFGKDILNFIIPDIFLPKSYKLCRHKDYEQMIAKK